LILWSPTPLVTADAHDNLVTDEASKLRAAERQALAAPQQWQRRPSKAPAGLLPRTVRLL
jgi:hypothetical protein